MPKKILIIYSSVGLGHKIVAENIGLALRERGAEVKQLDLLEFYPTDRLAVYSTAIYKKIIKYWPRLWGFFYTSSFLQAIALPLRIPLARRKAKKLMTLIHHFQPDLTLSTHPAPSALVASLKQQGSYA